MSIFVTFGPVDMTREENLRVGERLPEPPAGRDYHVCAGEDGALYFGEVWESRAAMERHNAWVWPVLQDLYGAERFPDGPPPGYAEHEVVVIHRPGQAPDAS